MEPKRAKLPAQVGFRDRRAFSADALRRHLSRWRWSDQTWKLSPQPQRPFSFGLMNVNPDASDFVS